MTSDRTFIADRIARERQIDLQISALTLRAVAPRRSWFAGLRGR